MPPVTTHDTPEQPSASSSILKERRFKLSRACDRCRRRRIKCDEGHPCQACLTASSACTFEEPGKRSHPHKSKRTATLEDRMHHLETLIQAIPPAVFAAGGAPPGNPSLFTFPPDSSSSPIAPFMMPSQFPSGVPPPSLHVFPLMNPSTHFTHDTKLEEKMHSPNPGFGSIYSNYNGTPPDHLSEESSRMSLAASYMYFDDEGYTRWQGETSGLPVLDLLLERHTPASKREHSEPSSTGPDPTSAPMASSPSGSNTEWFPDRTLRRTDVNPQTLWRMITSYIVPELMDSLVQCYLSTSYYILPFLHVPTFLEDYGNPQKWGEPGFAAFIVSICCLASRHMDDTRVRADPTDSISAGTQWFELLGRLRTLTIADRPTLYNIQASLIAAIYAVGLGKLSRAASLLTESITMCIDAGLHRSADTYDLFDSIEDEVRKRTFWSVYIWDKQLSAHFGRPSMIRLRDCDVAEPAPVDDEFITRDGLGVPPIGTECRLTAFICSIRIMVVLESVLDVPPSREGTGESSSFMLRATSMLSGSRRFKEMREEEALLDDIHRSVPPYWAHSTETMNAEDTIRLTQAERLFCAEHFVRLLIYRHRFSELIAERTNGGDDEQSEAEKEAMRAAHNSALQIIAAHLHVAKKGLMTYYGVHVIHQLTQAGRTLVAILLCCKTEALQHLIPSGLDALRSCVGLLRRFSGRYVCGLRSGDLMEEFCRLTQIPLDQAPSSNPEGPPNNTRPAWIRPVRKKAPSAPRSCTSNGDSPPQHSSPESFSPSEFFAETPKSAISPFPPSLPGPSQSKGTASAPPNLQYPATNGGREGPRGSPPIGFMDTSGGGGGGRANIGPGGGEAGNGGVMEMLGIRGEEGQVYLSSAEMMALFNVGDGVGVGVDVGHMFTSQEGYIHGAVAAAQQQQQERHQNGLRGFSPNPAFMKMSGLVNGASP